MRVLWYASQEKLKNLDDRGPAWLEGLSAKLRLGIQPLNGEIEGKFRTNDSKTTSQLIARVEQRIRRDYDVVDAVDLKPGKPPLFFGFEGHTARLLLNDEFWTATANENVATLLVGSSANTFGSTGLTPHVDISPSVDPLGAVLSLISENAEAVVERSRASSSLSYTWSKIFFDSVEQLQIPWNALPTVRGIAIYAGLQPATKHLFRETKYSGAKIEYIAVGSPIYIEQI